MKKIFIVILCIIIVLGVGLGVFFYFQKAKLPVERIFPEKAILYVQLSDIQKNLKEIRATQLWQNISGIDYGHLLKQSQLDQSKKDLMTLILSQISNPSNQAIFTKFFGQEITLGLYPMEIRLRDIPDNVDQLTAIVLIQMVDEVFSNVFFVTRLQPDVQFVEFLAQFFNLSAANIPLTRFEYEGYIIHTAVIPLTPPETQPPLNLSISFVRIKDLLVIGVGQKAIRRTIDVYTGYESSLANDSMFQQVQERYFSPSSIKIYLNIQAFFAMLKKNAIILTSLTKESIEDVEQELDKTLKKIAGFKSIGVSAQGGKLSKLRVNFIFDQDTLQPELSAFYSCLPKENQTIQFIPKDVLGYQWSSCFELKNFWDQIETGMTQTASDRMGASTRVREFEQAVGLRIKEDVLPAFGNEIGGYLADIVTGGLFPIPQLLLFIRIEDQTKAEGLLGKLLDQPFLVLKQENYFGISITSVVLPFGEQLKPSYCFLDRYLLLAVHSQLLKDSIVAYNDQSLSLRNSEDFRAVDFGLTQKNRDVQFVKIDKLLEKVEGVIEWADQWALAQQQQKEAFKSGSEQRLADIKKDIAQKEEEFTNLQERLSLLEEEISDSKTKGLDAGEKQTERQELDGKIENLEKDIAVAYEQKEEYQTIIHGYEKNMPDSEQRRFYLDEVVYPILKGLSSMKAIGTRTTLEKGVFESDVFIKIAE